MTRVGLHEVPPRRVGLMNGQVIPFKSQGKMNRIHVVQGFAGKRDAGSNGDEAEKKGN
jgi:hypothetical protein